MSQTNKELINSTSCIYEINDKYYKQYILSREAYTVPTSKGKQMPNLNTPRDVLDKIQYPKGHGTQILWYVESECEIEKKIILMK